MKRHPWEDNIRCGGTAPSEWRPAIERCIWAIDKLLDDYGLPKSIFTIDQIKVKFGGLRFYWGMDSGDMVNEIPDIVWSEVETNVAVAEAWVEGYEAAKEKYAPRIVKREKQPPAIREDE